MRQDLYSLVDRYPVPISSFALRADIGIFGGHFGDDSYYADFAGIAKKYAPFMILEIGVRFGYSGIAMCLGAIAAQEEPLSRQLLYTGIDACFFSHLDDPTILSHEVARPNFAAQVPTAHVELFHHDTRQGLPQVVSERLDCYNLINVDGDHSYEGAYGDLTRVWPLLRPGGVIIVDDTGMVEVKQAVDQFRDEHKDELEGFCWHPNERGFAIFLRGTR